jgi:hypothetical protein
LVRMSPMASTGSMTRSFCLTTIPLWNLTSTTWPFLWRCWKSWMNWSICARR